MAEAQGIRDLTTEGVQSILDGESDNDSQCSLPQVPDATIDRTGLSSIRQNLSSSFNHLWRGITNCIGRDTNQSQNPTDMEIDTEQLSPTSLRTQLVTYQNTVKDLYYQNQRNAELLGRLETVVSKKESKISRLQLLETDKDLRIIAQQRDFQNQLITEQTAQQEVSNTLEELQRELEAIKADQNNQNPMDVSSSTDAMAELNHIKQKAEEEKWLAKEKLAKTKADQEQALKDKSCEIATEIECIKKHMEDQMHQEREATSKANNHQLQTIILELHSLKEKQDKDTTDRKVREKALLDNIKASIDLILSQISKEVNTLA